MFATFLSLLIGFLSGVLSGLFGIGGGVLVILGLIWVFNMSQHTAQGTSLVALLAPVGIFAVINYYRGGNVDVVKGIAVAIGITLGAIFGSKVALGLDEVMMRKAFAIFLIIMGIIQFIDKK